MQIRIALMTILMIACAPAGDDRTLQALTRELSQPTDEAENRPPESYSQSSLSDFAGHWEAISDDETNIETADIEIANGKATGVLQSLERGYFSGNVKVTGEANIEGTLRSGALDLQVVISNDEGQNRVTGRAMRRGEYLIVRIGESEQPYARKGVSLVKSAEGSADAQRLLNTIGGKILSTTSNAAGRGGAFVGGRVRLALCSDGSIAFDASDVATTGGYNSVDAGSSTSRRGQWSIVLLAGSPVVRAEWNGTGTSYSLTRYFRIEPRGNGATVDGTLLPITGNC